MPILRKGWCDPSRPSWDVKSRGTGGPRGAGAEDLTPWTGLVIAKGAGKQAGVVQEGLSN